MENSLASNFPDEVICHILSFLPTKLAFSTTILSKTWTTSLSQSLTALYFDFQRVPDFELDFEAFLHFCCFVDTVTLSTKLIKSFNLTCDSQHWDNERFALDSWIETVKQHPVEIIQISCLFSPLSPSFFKFPTLVILKLKMVRVVGDISVNLPLLKTLDLDTVSFINENKFRNLLHGCPVLEHLVANIHYTEESEEDVTTGEFKSLSKLITADVSTYEKTYADFLKATSNVQILTIKMNNGHPKINSYSVFENLIELHLICYDNFRFWDDVVELLQYCPKLQILSFKKDVKEFSINRNYPASSVPKCISCPLRSCTIYYEGWKYEVHLTKYILQNAPLLKTMEIIIHNSFSLYRKRNQHYLKELSSFPRISPQCTLSIRRGDNS